MNLNKKEFVYIREKRKRFYNVGMEFIFHSTSPTKSCNLLHLLFKLQMNVFLTKKEVSYLGTLFSRSGSAQLNRTLDYVTTVKNYSIRKVSKNLKRTTSS